jgi:hypothetical protein
LSVTLPAVDGFQAALPKGWFPVFYLKPETIFRLRRGLLVGLVGRGSDRRILTTRIVDGLRHVG